MIILSIQSTQLQGAEIGLDVRSSDSPTTPALMESKSTSQSSPSIAQSASIDFNPEDTEVSSKLPTLRASKGVVKLSEARSCYEAGHYKSALLKYRLVSRMEGLNDLTRVKALVGCAELFYGSYSEINQDLRLARKYARDVLAIDTIDEESRLIAERILEDKTRQDKVLSRAPIAKAGAEGDRPISAIVAQAVTLYDKKSYTKAKAKFEGIICTISNPQDKARVYRYLARMYYDGRGIKKDYSKAKQFWEIVIKEQKAYKIDKGLALRGIGLLYYYGKGVKKI